MENTEPRSQFELEYGLDKSIAKPKVGHNQNIYKIGPTLEEKLLEGEEGLNSEGLDLEKIAPENLISGKRIEKRVKGNYKQRHLSEFLQTERVKTTELQHKVH